MTDKTIDWATATKEEISAYWSRSHKELMESYSIYKAGQQIIATEDHGFVSSLTGEWYHSIDKGTVLVANHDKHPDTVWVSHGGYASTIPRAITRLATPDDPGYLATREQWFEVKDQAERYANDKFQRWRATAIAALVMCVWVGLSTTKVIVVNGSDAQQLLAPQTNQAAKPIEPRLI